MTQLAALRQLQNVARVGITGINGLLGWHTHCYLKQLQGVTVLGADRDTFHDEAKLNAFVESCDSIIHFAGMNRGDESLLEETNLRLMDAILRACRRTGRRPHIILASSTHIERDTAYGRSKKLAGERLLSWAAETNGRATVLVLPNVFGEGGKPFYNSVVSTFAYQIANDEKPKIDIDREIEFIHAQEVASIAIRVIHNRECGELRPRGSKMTVSSLLEKLRTFAEEYRNNRIPPLLGPIDITLFNSLRYYMFPSFYPRKLDLRSDPRGVLYEAVKSPGGGQTFLSTTKPGITRGNHFHYYNIERFLVIHGSAIIKIRKLFSDIVHTFPVDGQVPAYVDMPTLHTHSITNIGDSDLVTLFWSNRIFNPEDPDTVREEV